MKILAKRFPEYNNGRLEGYYTESYSFRRTGNTLVITQYVSNVSHTYNRTLSIRTYDDTEEGRANGNEVYKRLRKMGYEIKHN
jgi:hypothetical protein